MDSLTAGTARRLIAAARQRCQFAALRGDPEAAAWDREMQDAADVLEQRLAEIAHAERDFDARLRELQAHAAATALQFFAQHSWQLGALYAAIWTFLESARDGRALSYAGYNEQSPFRELAELAEEKAEERRVQPHASTE